ncbi:hypothetical protein NC652_002371 [Populus alba x Populus x berolinensis]|nr:hypothetical protein NC652_002371 [Populus alba x Populus x berolinensis]
MFIGWLQCCVGWIAGINSRVLAVLSLQVFLQIACATSPFGTGLGCCYMQLGCSCR